MLAAFIILILIIAVATGFAVIAVTVITTVAIVTLTWVISFAVLYTILGEHNSLLAAGLAIPLAVLALAGASKFVEKKQCLCRM